MKTYFDQLMENKYFRGKFIKEFDKVTKDEKPLYTLYLLSRFRQELKYLEKQYKDDDQKELFLMGHKEMIKKLEKQLKDVKLKYSYEDKTDGKKLPDSGFST